MSLPAKQKPHGRTRLPLVTSARLGYLQNITKKWGEHQSGVSDTRTYALVDGRNNQQTSSIVQKETAEVNAEENETPIEAQKEGSIRLLSPLQERMGGGES